jgi:hypothetical protein
MDEASNRAVATREVLLAWCIWLLVSWVTNLGAGSPEPAVRGMLQSIMLGMGLIWPAWRLSQGYNPRCGWRIVTDLILLLLLTQVVLWPVRFVLMAWTTTQLLIINGVLIAWGAAAGLCAWIGQRGVSAFRRVAAMTVCVLLLTAGWLSAAALGEAWPVQWSPLYMLWMLAEGRAAYDAAAMGWRLLVVAGATATVWAVVRYRRAAASQTSYQLIE